MFLKHSLAVHLLVTVNMSLAICRMLNLRQHVQFIFRMSCLFGHLLHESYNNLFLVTSKISLKTSV